jgi:1-aminocyclopropane-1-carboxylate deaminase
MQLPLKKIPLQKLVSHLFNSHAIDILRLDQVHTVVSGNKWFKLKYHIREASLLDCETIATFGGAYSNHIVATAYACKEAGLKSIGIIRGEKSAKPSPTLIAAEGYGMELHFVSREEFKNKESLKEKFEGNFYWINEGGYSLQGMKGASEILSLVDRSAYTHIICSCGTGTTIAGFINAALHHQTIIGISALKGHDGLENDIKNLLPSSKKDIPFTILHNYHFGGYAKHPKELIEWMKELWHHENLPTDIVYTSKLLYAVKDLCIRQYFPGSSRVLIIHSGGLQGNLSLPVGTLPF